MTYVEVLRWNSLRWAPYHIGTYLLLGGVRPSYASSIFLAAICTWATLCFQSSVYQCMVCTLVRKTNESKVISRVNNTQVQLAIMNRAIWTAADTLYSRRNFDQVSLRTACCPDFSIGCVILYQSVVQYRVSAICIGNVRSERFL